MSHPQGGDGAGQQGKLFQRHVPPRFNSLNRALFLTRSKQLLAYFVPNIRSPASPSPGTIYPLSFNRSSSAPVVIGTSGCAWAILATPSGAASRHRKRISRAPLALSIDTAAAEELPVASIGSTTMVLRFSMPAGSLA